MSTISHAFARLAAVGVTATALTALAIAAPATAAAPANTNLTTQVCSDETHVDLTWQFEGDDALPVDATYEVTAALLTVDDVTTSGGPFESTVEHLPDATSITLLDVPTVDRIVALVIVTTADGGTISASVAGSITVDCTTDPETPTNPVDPVVVTEVPAAPTLPNTGNETLVPLSLTALALLALGGAFLLRRRRA